MVGSKEEEVVSLRYKPPYINGIEKPTSGNSWVFRVSWKILLSFGINIVT